MHSDSTMQVSASCAARVEAPQRTRMRWQPALGLGMGIVPGASGRSGSNSGEMRTRREGVGMGTRKRNAPGGRPRAFACLGDRVDRSPRRKISRGGGRNRISSASRKRPHRGRCAKVQCGGWNAGRRSSGKSGGISWRSCSACCDRRAHYTRHFRIANIFFTFLRQCSERSSEPYRQSAGNGSHAHRRAQKKAGRPESPCSAPRIGGGVSWVCICICKSRKRIGLTAAAPCRSRGSHRCSDTRSRS
jgi:hypothetical protein